MLETAISMPAEGGRNFRQCIQYHKARAVLISGQPFYFGVYKKVFLEQSSLFYTIDNFTIFVMI